MISDMINQDQRRQHRECACQNLVVMLSCYLCYDIKLITFKRLKQEETCLWEESGKTVIVVGCVGGQSAIRHKSVFQAVEIPTGVTHLDSCLRIIVILTDVSSSDDRSTWPMWTERHSLILLCRIERRFEMVPISGGKLRWCLSGVKPQSEVFEQRTSFFVFLDVQLGHFPVDEATLPPKKMMWILLLSLMFLCGPDTSINSSYFFLQPHSKLAKPISGKWLGIFGFANYVG